MARPCPEGAPQVKDGSQCRLSCPARGLCWDEKVFSKLEFPCAGRGSAAYLVQKRFPRNIKLTFFPTAYRVSKWAYMIISICINLNLPDSRDTAEVPSRRPVKSMRIVSPSHKNAHHTNILSILPAPNPYVSKPAAERTGVGFQCDESTEIKRLVLAHWVNGISILILENV